MILGFRVFPSRNDGTKQLNSIISTSSSNVDELIISLTNKELMDSVMFDPNVSISRQCDSNKSHPIGTILLRPTN